MENDLIPGLPDDVAEECLIRVAHDLLSVVYSVCRRWRQEVLSPNFYRRRKLARTHRPMMVVNYLPLYPDKRPTQQLALLDPTTGKTCKLPTHPVLQPKQSPFFWSSPYEAIVGVGRLVVTITINEDEQKPVVHIYDLLTGFWHEGTPMPGPIRSDFACASDGVRQVFVAGGFYSDCTGRSALRYDVEKDAWDDLPDMIFGGWAAGHFHAGIFYSVGHPCFREEIGLPDDVYWINLFTVSSGDWSVVGMAKVTEKNSWDDGMFEIASDGKMYYCDQIEKRIMVRDGTDLWKKLCDLPPKIIDVQYFTSWNEGLLLVGEADGLFVKTYLVYFLALDGVQRNLSWKREMIIENQSRKVEVMATLEI